MQKEREGGRDGGVASGRDAADQWQRPSTSCVFFLVEQRKKVTKMNSATAPNVQTMSVVFTFAMGTYWTRCTDFVSHTADVLWSESWLAGFCLNRLY